MLKSPHITSSDGVDAKSVKREEKSERKVAKDDDGGRYTVSNVKE
jgi:hypothetical protein